MRPSQRSDPGSDASDIDRPQSWRSLTPRATFCRGRPSGRSRRHRPAGGWRSDCRPCSRGTRPRRCGGRPDEDPDPAVGLGPGHGGVGAPAQVRGVGDHPSVVGPRTTTPLGRWVASRPAVRIRRSTRFSPTAKSCSAASPWPAPRDPGDVRTPTMWAPCRHRPRPCRRRTRRTELADTRIPSSPWMRTQPSSGSPGEAKISSTSSPLIGGRPDPRRARNGRHFRRASSQVPAQQGVRSHEEGWPTRPREESTEVPRGPSVSGPVPDTPVELSLEDAPGGGAHDLELLVRFGPSTRDDEAEEPAKPG